MIKKKMKLYYKMHFVILPHHLFSKKYLNPKYKYIIWEHPHYFKKYKYNKKKIILHRASMKYYYDYLKSKNFSVKYIDFDKKFQLKEYYIFDPIDKIVLPGKYSIFESPNFILSKKEYEKYREKTKKFRFYNFHNWCKKHNKYCLKIESKDKYNRKPFDPKKKIPKIPDNISDKKYIEKGIKYVKKKFNKNYGNVNNFMFPITHKTAKKWLNDFIKKRFKNFGKYQDSISKEEPFLYHSILSTSINIGLLNPIEIIKKIEPLKSRIPINSYEGFLRQLFWREYQRYCYLYWKHNKPYIKNEKKITKDWYTGKTGIEPIDDCIIKGFDTGYLHHIERLMVIGNFMNLSEIRAKDGYRWFMEFSCDSYEWVMYQNVYDMVFFVSGGETMTRPYFASSNYILKMSDYKKGEWSDKWDKLYHKYIKKNKKKLWKFRYYLPTLTK